MHNRWSLRCKQQWDNTLACTCMYHNFEMCTHTHTYTHIVYLYTHCKSYIIHMLIIMWLCNRCINVNPLDICLHLHILYLLQLDKICSVCCCCCSVFIDSISMVMRIRCSKKCITCNHLVANANNNATIHLSMYVPYVYHNS